MNEWINRVYVGDCRDGMRKMIADGVKAHACVTSPPYWGLRDYGTGAWNGGDDERDHSYVLGGTAKSTLGNYGNALSQEAIEAKVNDRGRAAYRHECGKCGAKRVDNQIGLEALHDCLGWATGKPCGDCHVCHIVEVFRLVRDLLVDDGTAWLNYGDCYYTPRYNGGIGDNSTINGQGSQEAYRRASRSKRNGAANRNQRLPGLKPKDMALMPARIALALQAPYVVPNCIKDERDKAWLAALVDGEGTISIRRYDSHSNGSDAKRCQDGFVPFISIGNNDRELLDRVVAITGFGSVGVKDRPKIDGRGIKSRRTYFGWRLDGNKAIEVIAAIYPYLVVKRKQAILSYTLDVSNKSGKALRGNRALPPDEQERRRTLKELVNRCNQREPVDLPRWCVEPPPQIVEPGWWVRSDVIWQKKNPMPESVNDRPTRAHEYLFLLAKSEHYYYDADAIKEPASPNTHARLARAHGGYAAPGQDEHRGILAPRPNRNGVNPKARIPGGWDTGDGNHRKLAGRYARGTRQNESFAAATSGAIVEDRNKRSVWTLATSPYPEAHFATYPPELIEPCILASTRPGQLVLDPFLGSGTTGEVCQRLGRDWIGCELQGEYEPLQRRRTAQLGMPL